MLLISETGKDCFCLVARQETKVATVGIARMAGGLIVHGSVPVIRNIHKRLRRRVAAPLVAAVDVPPAAAVLAICSGSFVAILPNDSFYWLVRKDALGQASEARAMATLSLGAIIQALTGLAVILATVALGGLA
jgi:hypothetical protein